MEAKEKAHRRTRVGRVVANCSKQTVKVQFEGIIQHPKYKKYIKRSTTWLVHDPESKCQAGDKVQIEECRRISKLKHWIVKEILEHGSAKTQELIKEKTDDSAGNHS